MLRTGNDTTVRRLMEIETSLEKKMGELGETAALKSTFRSLEGCLELWSQEHNIA